MSACPSPPRAPALRFEHRDPIAETARAIAVDVLHALDLEERGLVYRDVVACGMHEGLPFEIGFKQHRTAYDVAPFTSITLRADAGGAPIRLAPADWTFAAHESHAAFPQPALRDVHLAGAPHALLAMLANGPLGDRLGALAEAGVSIRSLDAGPAARRAGSGRSGIKLVVSGWPNDPTSLVYLLDTVVALHRAIVASIPLLAGEGATTLAMHPEVIAHEAALHRPRDASATRLSA